MPKRRSGAGSAADILAALTRPHPRVECYGRILASAQDNLAGFFQAHPEWTGDERSQKAMEFYLMWISELLEILDDYHLAELPAEEP